MRLRGNLLAASVFIPSPPQMKDLEIATLNLKRAPRTLFITKQSKLTNLKRCYFLKIEMRMSDPVFFLDRLQKLKKMKKTGYIW